MPRKQNDGRGRVGGRKAGTPNKDKPLKTFLREHSLNYFTPSLTAANFKKDANLYKALSGIFGKNPFSPYEKDLLMLKASDRVKAELDLLKFHTPQMQATSVDLSLQEQNASFSERLRRINAGEDIPSPSE